MHTRSDYGYMEKNDSTKDLIDNRNEKMLYWQKYVIQDWVDW